MTNIVSVTFDIPCYVCPGPLRTCCTVTTAVVLPGWWDCNSVCVAIIYELTRPIRVKYSVTNLTTIVHTAILSQRSRFRGPPNSMTVVISMIRNMTMCYPAGSGRVA